MCGPAHAASMLPAHGAARMVTGWEGPHSPQQNTPIIPHTCYLFGLNRSTPARRSLRQPCRQSCARRNTHTHLGHAAGTLHTSRARKAAAACYRRRLTHSSLKEHSPHHHHAPTLLIRGHQRTPCMVPKPRCAMHAQQCHAWCVLKPGIPLPAIKNDTVRNAMQGTQQLALNLWHPIMTCKPPPA